MPAIELTPPDAVRVARPRAVVIDDAKGFAGLSQEWDELLRASAADCPFLTWEWLHAWWTHLSNSRRLRVIAVSDGNRLIGIAPLSVSRGSLPWLSRLEFLGTGFAGSDYLDLIVRKGSERECLDAMTGALSQQNLALYLDHLPAGATVARALSHELAERGWSSRISQSGMCPFAQLAGHTWESYLATLKPSHQTKCRRYLGTLNKKFTFSFEKVAAEADRHEALSALMSFHEQRWTPRGGSTAFQTAALRSFHHAATARALQSGWLRMYVLRLNGTAAAVAYCFARNGRFYLYQHGFDQQYRQYSVGVVLLGLAIRAALEEGASEFDMLYGDEPYKALWSHETRPLGRIELFPAHIGGRLHHRTVEAERSMRKLARRLFPRKPCNSNAHPAGAAS